jgi:hypothetical protein
VARNPLWVAPYWSTRFASLLTISVTNLADGPWREIIAVAVQAPTLAATRSSQRGWPVCACVQRGPSRKPLALALNEMDKFKDAKRRESVFAGVRRNLLSQGLESCRARPPRMPLQQHLEKRGVAFCSLAGVELQNSRHGLCNYECSPARPSQS